VVRHLDVDATREGQGREHGAMILALHWLAPGGYG
jgi:hypothetical protein